MSVGFRRAVAADSVRLSEIAFLSKSHWPYSPEYLKAAKPLLAMTYSRIERQPVFCFMERGEVVGFFAFLEDKSGVVLDDFWLLPHAIGRGYGRLMWYQAREFAREQGWQRFELTADPYAASFYSKMGCETLGPRPSRVSFGPAHVQMAYLIS